jgi:peptidoglycan/LPS O-acetylase OafA/YrhL
MNPGKYLSTNDFLLCIRGFLALSVAHWHVPIEHSFVLPGRISVIIFFGISGLSIFSKLISYAIDYKTVIRYFKNRIIRIYPPLFISIFLMIFLNQEVAFNYRSVLQHLFFFNFNHNYPLNGVLWTLGVEMHFYILAPIIIYISNKFIKNNLNIHTLIFILLTLLPILFSFYSKNYSILDSRNIIGNLSHFYVSLLVVNGMRFKISKFVHLLLLLFVIFTSAFLYYNYIKIYWIAGNIFNNFSIFLILTLVDNKDFIFKNIFFDIFIFFGKISFGIYLYHYFALSIFPIQYYGYLPWLVTTIILAYCSHKFYESYFLSPKRFYNA